MVVTSSWQLPTTLIKTFSSVYGVGISMAYGLQTRKEKVKISGVLDYMPRPRPRPRLPRPLYGPSLHVPKPPGHGLKAEHTQYRPAAMHRPICNPRPHWLQSCYRFGMRSYHRVPHLEATRAQPISTWFVMHNTQIGVRFGHGESVGVPDVEVHLYHY